MRSFETEWQSDDGLVLFGRGWEPEIAPKAVICLVHGLGEHSGRYEHVAEVLTATGYAILTFDLRGHGRSAGPRGHMPSFDAFMRDIDRLLLQAEIRYPAKPRFLYGHSLGGILVLNYALRRKPDLRGMVVTSPGLRTALEEQKAKVTLVRLLGSLFPSLALPSGLDPRTLSHDQTVVQAYIHDPLVHDKITLGFGKIMLDVIPWTFAHAHELSLPLLLMHGTDDALTYARGSEEFARLAGEKVTLKLWPGLYHELHNEPQKREVLQSMIEWLDSHL
ncbi:MAG: alpha/beta hydrolase [Candidatus Caldarchaeum sp.]